MQITPFMFEPLLADPMRASGKLADNLLKNEDAETAEPEEEPAAPPPPTFSEEELYAAKQAAYDEGFAAGKAEGKREVDHEAELLRQQTNGILEAINARLPQMEEQQQEFLARRQPELGSLVLSCAGRIALEALRKEPVADIEIMIAECLETLMGKQEILVSVHPKLQTPLTDLFGRKIKIDANSDMSPGDCRITWNSGESTREIDRIWSDIETVIERHFSIAPAAETETAAEEPDESPPVESAAGDIAEEPDAPITEHETIPYETILTEGEEDNG